MGHLVNTDYINRDEKRPDGLGLATLYVSVSPLASGPSNYSPAHRTIPLSGSLARGIVFP